LIALALEAGAAAIVSENRDLLGVSPIKGNIPVLNSASFLRMLREAGLED
jgi:predicted nucleic acid-binding protein